MRRTAIIKQATNDFKARMVAAIMILAIVIFYLPEFAAAARDSDLIIAPNFLGHPITLADTIEFKLNRQLTSNEGRLAVFVDDLDVTSLFSVVDMGLTYVPQSPLLPTGEHRVSVHLVSPNGDWKQVAEFPITLVAAGASSSVPSQHAKDSGEAEPSGSASDPETADESKIEFTPNVAINFKGQNQALTFPRESAPTTNPSGEIDGQANVQMKVTNRGWTLNNRFDFVGAGSQRNALRFGELQNEAPKVDLSSYLVELTKDRFAVRLGHVSFGSTRHLINSFSSRGLTVTVPIGKQSEISLLAANGTSIVGYDNFVGITRRKHSVVAVMFAREFIKEKPGALRMEVSAMRGSLLPLTNFNQSEVNDAEKSLGIAFRVSGNAIKQRLRYEAGFTRSRFRNPSDPQIEQGAELKPILHTTRNARYAEVSFDILRGLKLWDERKLKVTGTYRHEEIEPLFRSVVAATQADRRQNQFEVSGTFGEINFAFGNLRDYDNLDEIASILRSITRRSNAVFGIALNSFFTPSKPIVWLPRISYTYDHVHQFGAAFPVGGEFTSASHIPDQESFSQSVNAQWQLNEKLSVSYRYNRAFQDNKQPGRNLADFESAVSGISVSFNPYQELSLSIDLTREGQRAFEQPRIDRTFRVGSQITWQTPLIKNSTISANVSTTLAGDAANLNDTRNTEFDVQWAYRFAFGKEKFKKMQAQFFIRYANRYGDAFDRAAVIRNFSKTQGINAGMTFNIF